MFDVRRPVHASGNNRQPQSASYLPSAKLILTLSLFLRKLAAWQIIVSTIGTDPFSFSYEEIVA
jgi:hypothetical protein